MNATIITAVASLIGVLMVGVLIPLYLVSRSDRQRREDQLEAARLHREDRDAEWARQDKVAAAAAKAAEDLAASQKAIADQAAHAATLLLARQNQSAEAQQRVAEQAAEAARLLAARQEESAAATARVAEQAEEAARLLAENTAIVAESAAETGKKLDTIHTLVNSNMTQAMQSEFEAVGRELAGMNELIALRRSLGQEPNAETLVALAKTQAKLAELEVNLAERAKIQEQVNRKIGLDVITTTSYRRQGDEEKTSVQVNNETQGIGPPGDEPMQSAEYVDEPPRGHGEGEG